MGNMETKPKVMTSTSSSSSSSAAVITLNNLPPAARRLRHIAKMDQKIRANVRHGKAHAMKLVIRGARASGKSTLLARLTGESFSQTYVPSQHIVTAKVAHWKLTGHPVEDTLLVDIWDVVDDGGSEGASSFSWTLEEKLETHVVDASTVEVYASTQCVILMLDLTSRASLGSVATTLASVPLLCPTVILGNKRDLVATTASERLIRTADITSLLSSRQRPRQVDYFEISLLNCFGLTQLQHYLSLPFLTMKVAATKVALQQLEQELVECRENISIERSEAKYSDYLVSFTPSSDVLSSSANGVDEPSEPSEHDVLDHATPPAATQTCESYPIVETTVEVLSSVCRDVPNTHSDLKKTLAEVALDSEKNKMKEDTSSSSPHTLSLEELRGEHKHTVADHLVVEQEMEVEAVSPLISSTTTTTTTTMTTMTLEEKDVFTPPGVMPFITLPTLPLVRPLGRMSPPVTKDQLEDFECEMPTFTHFYSDSDADSASECDNIRIASTTRACNSHYHPRKKGFYYSSEDEDDENTTENTTSSVVQSRPRTEDNHPIISSLNLTNTVSRDEPSSATPCIASSS